MTTGAARTRRSLAAAGATLLLAAAMLVGCASPLTPKTPSDGGSSANGGASSAGGGAPTCETIIAPALVDQFAELGWTARTDPFYVGPTEVPGGVSCTWGDFEAGATDVVQMYGWAPVEADVSAELQGYLADQGWKREEADGVVYLTESMPSAEWADEQGYGMTYAFGDGWVALADTKSGLAVITWRG
ncbi:hypothetical protein M1D46_08825 [Microbacterium sp. JZ70]